ncbi:MAG TPA: S8 family serine peptidase [Candidatus Kapabacteria bacterium]|nr:S8 family serine peptidase [Candidatus Kapabacteria bacterium]
MALTLVFVKLRSLVVLLLLILAVPVIAQQKQPRAASSVILKLRSIDALSDQKLLTKIQNATGTSVAQAHAFQRSIPRNTMSAASQGLERVFVLPLSGPRDAQQIAAELKADPLIEYAQPNYIYSIDAVEAPNDPDYDKQWFLRNVRADRAWEITRGDSSIAIGVVDTGVDWLHPDLNVQFKVNKLEDRNNNGVFDAWPSNQQRRDVFGNDVTGDLDGQDQDRNGYTDDVIGYDFVDQESLNFGDARDRDPMPGDEHGHGTQVSGVVAAKQNNAKGISGVAPGCRIVALRAFDATGNAEDDDVAAAIVYAADNGVRILNLSFGDIVPSMLQRDAIRYAVTQGVTVFASSGNEGGFDRHYPSDFDEVVSVGATANLPYEDVVASFTTYGESLDLVAPGGDIYTTDLDSGYKSTNGTSFSAPVAAAIGALLLSKDKRLTPEQIKGILMSTTRDIGTRGYDPETANGRVDALSALAYTGSATVEFISPHTNDGVKIGDELKIRGTVHSTLFESWQLSFSKALDTRAVPTPDSRRQWITIAEGTDQRLDQLLGTWGTADLTAGLYTLRLALRSNDGRSTEERINVHVVGEAPKFTLLEIDSIYLHDRRGLMLRANLDQVSRLVVRYREQSSNVWSQKSDDRMTRTHIVTFSTNEVRAGVTYVFEAVATNTAGESVTQSAASTLADGSVSQRGFATKSYALPPGYALDSVFTVAGSDHVMMSEFPNGLNFGPLKGYRFDGARFVQDDSLAQTWIPRDLGSTQGISTELLIQADRFSQLYRLTGDRLFAEKIFESDKNSEFWGAALADIDGDGMQEIIGRSSDAIGDLYRALKFGNGSYRELAVARNETSTITTRSSNRFTEPNVAHADLDGDGREEILAIDNDADVMLFSFGSGEFSTVFKDENSGTGEGSTVAMGDVNGDGRQDLVYAFHSDFDQNIDREYDPLFWTVKVFLNDGALKFTKVYEDRYFYARPLNPYRSSVTAIPNVTGRGADNIVLSLFPNFYLLEWDAQANTVRPVWHYPSSLSPRGAVAFDFDRNGIREFGFVANDSIRFFERESEYADRTLTPGGLTATPLADRGVLLDWGKVDGAEGYLILRAEEGASELEVIDSVGTTSYLDETVSIGESWIYSVIAIDDEKLESQSQIAFVVRAVVHELPRFISILPTRDQLRVSTSEKLDRRAISGAQFIIDDSITVSTAVIASDSTLVLTPSRRLAAGQHTLRTTSWELRDVFNSPFDTTQRITFTQPIIDDDSARFYAIRWRFEEGKRIRVVFNSIPGDDALDVSHYDLTPFGDLLRVYRDTTDTKALYIDLDANTEIIALGKPFVLCITDIHDINGVPIDPLEGRCIGVTLTEPDLTNIMVYPNPVKRSDNELMFARLTAEAEIRIYTLDMKFLHQVRTTERNGGVSWDLRDENGEPLPSGIYLYYVTGKNDEGQEVEANTQKFVIIADR